jgi:DNA invertase Pin-like site-specific DNA recombinase
MSVLVRHSVAYVRVRDRGPGAWQAVSAQEVRCRHFAAAHGWGGIAALYIDGPEGEGTTSPALARLLEDARAGMIERVVVVAWTALAGAAHHLTAVEQMLDECTVEVVALEDGEDTSAAPNRLRVLLADGCPAGAGTSRAVRTRRSVQVRSRRRRVSPA